jgi:hypothetical protein
MSNFEEYKDSWLEVWRSYIGNNESTTHVEAYPHKKYSMKTAGSRKKALDSRALMQATIDSRDEKFSKYIGYDHKSRHEKFTLKAVEVAGKFSHVPEETPVSAEGTEYVLQCRCSPQHPWNDHTLDRQWREETSDEQVLQRLYMDAQKFEKKRNSADSSNEYRIVKRRRIVIENSVASIEIARQITDIVETEQLTP